MNDKTTENKRSSKAENILQQIDENTKLGDIRKIAKEIKQDHDLAMELWATNEYLPRLLAILIMDKKQLTEDVINDLVENMEAHTYDERNNLMDWFMANQLAKSKKTIAFMESWEHSPFPLQQRIFWYYQARLRWTGKTEHENTEQLLNSLEENFTKEEPEVQWAMNFTAGWIGVYNEEYRDRCMRLGEEAGLYKGEKVPRGCTPNYLPEFITMEVNKRQNK